MSGGAIAGIVVGCIVGVIAMLALGFHFLRRRKIKRALPNDDTCGTRATTNESGAAPVFESDPDAAVVEKDGYPTAAKRYNSHKNPAELSSGSVPAHEMESPAVEPLPVELDSQAGYSWNNERIERR